MKTRQTLAALLLVCGMAIFSCTTLKRYRSDTFGGTDNSLAKIELSRTQLDPPDTKDVSKTVWDLSAQGQAALIWDLNHRNKKNSDFKKSLETKYLKKEDPPADYINKNLQLVFVISRTHSFESIDLPKNNFSVADRLEALDFQLAAPAGSPVKFVKWNQYNTIYGNIDIGDVSFSKSLSVTAGYGDTTQGFNLSGTGSLSQTEAQHLKYRFVQFTGVLHPGDLKVHEDGDREIDLTGNVVANVSLRMEAAPSIVYALDGLKDDDDNYNTPDKLTVKAVPVMIPKMETIPDAIVDTLTLHYFYRHVTNGHGKKTFYEWNDAVVDYEGTYQKPVKILDKKDIVPPFYYIGKINPSAPFSHNTRLKLQNIVPARADQAHAPIHNLQFATQAEAVAFYDWLINYKAAQPSDPIKMGNFMLVLDDGNGALASLTKTQVLVGADNYGPLPVYQ
jgi:hypothetical protein